MKCERLVTMFKVVFDNNIEMILKPTNSGERIWLLQVGDYDLTVSEIYDVAKSILESSEQQTIGTILVPVFGSVKAIIRETTKEEYFMNVIGDKSCNASIE